ncbi:MAG: molybdate ABC transporter permease subunit [Pseudomonadota bacterium]|nr:molybdate ABC transporter permease subunit [Pseudomonadota bacterium]
MFPEGLDLQPLWLTLRLAAVTTCVLMFIALPTAWWLAHSRSRWRHPVAAVVALPLVLPPSVLGFYLLLAMGPDGPIGWLTQRLHLGLLPFTFQGLVLASVVYSLPFAVQPLRDAFEATGQRPLDVAATLRAGPWDRWIHVALPLARRGLLSAAVLSFAHTIGEFGVVLMIGGNIPGATQVLSVAVYGHVEAGEYASAHLWSALTLGLSFALLLALHLGGQRTAWIKAPK